MHKILLAGRSANIVNLDQTVIQSPDVEVVTATNAEEAKSLLDDSLDAVIIGAGLPIDTRLEIYKLVLEKTSHTAVFCSAKDLGADGLEIMVKHVVNTFDTV